MINWNDPFHLLAAGAVVAVVILGLYYVMSPYQICTREMIQIRFCLIETSW